MGSNTLGEQLLLFEEDKNIVLNYNTNTQECKNCKKVLPLTEFRVKNVYSDNLGVLSKYCISCTNKLHKEHQLRKVNIPYPDEDYKCPICLKNEEELKSKQIVINMDTYEPAEHKRKKNNVWRLDHNHNTGEVRGWICNSCNVSLGQLNDDIDTLKRATNYLEVNNGSSKRICGQK